jgi:cobalt-precorrin 5A hydrolase
MQKETDTADNKSPRADKSGRADETRQKSLDFGAVEISPSAAPAGIHNPAATAVVAVTGRGARIAMAIARAGGFALHVKKGVLKDAAGGGAVWAAGPAGASGLSAIVGPGGAGEPGASADIEPVQFERLGPHLAEIFKNFGGIVLVMSTGAAVRAMAPFVTGRAGDPSVVVHDEAGRYVVSALSGKDGADALAYAVSSITGAEPVVTGADYVDKTCTCGVSIKKGAGKEEILSAVKKACQKAGIEPRALKCIAGAWIARGEPGLLAAAAHLDLQLRFIPRWLIDLYYENNPDADRSDMMLKTLGVYGVSEPCAMLAGRNTALLLKRSSFDGVIVALAEERLMGAERAPLRIGSSRATLIIGASPSAVDAASELYSQAEDFYICASTEYGYSLYREKFCSRAVREKFSEASLRQFIHSHGIYRVIDCLRPYDDEAASFVKKTCMEAGVEYVERSKDTQMLDEINYERLIVVPSLGEAARRIIELDIKKPLLTTGSKELGFAGRLGGREVFVRVSPFENSIASCVSAGIKRQNILAMQSPFSSELNRALIRHYGIDCLVTKEGGREGGFYEKVTAAIDCGIYIIVVKQ